MAKAAGGGGRRGGRTRSAGGGGAFTPRTFATPSDMDAWGDATWAAGQASLSAVETEVLTNYQGSAYQRINATLRKGAGNTGNENWDDPDYIEDSMLSAQAIDGVIARMPGVPEDVVVYRGLGNSGSAAAAGWLPGAQIEDAGFMSTTLRESKTDTFSYSAGGTPAVLEIQVPKGSRGVYLQSLTGWKRGENELLLPRNQRFEVITNTATDYKRRVVVRLV